MAKKQTRRSISVSRTTYERLKSFCETNNISMSQLVETRVNDFLGPNDAPSAPSPSASAAFAASFGAPASASPGAPRPMAARPPIAAARPIESTAARAGLLTPVSPATPATPAAPAGPAPSAPAPMTSAAARFAVDPPPPIIKPRQDTAAPKPAEKRPEQIFTF